MDRHIFLIGFMGTGKSTVGALLGESCGRHVLEMDAELERREGRTIAEIFETDGEAYFRKAETALLESLKGETPQIVSCGGGVPLRERNRELLRGSGMVVLLDAKPETIAQRVAADESRPLLKNRKSAEEIRALMEQRAACYLQAADLVVATDGKEPADICAEITERL